MEDLSNVPEEILTIIESFDEDKDRYKECARVLEALELKGWTFEYGLDAEPYDLKQL